MRPDRGYPALPVPVAQRDEDGDPRITSVRPHTDDVWDIAAVSAGARQTLLAGLARYAAGLSGRWRLTLTGMRDGDEATWLAGQLPGGRAVPAPPVPGIGFTHDEVPLAPGIRSGLDRSAGGFGGSSPPEPAERRSGRGAVTASVARGGAY